MSKASNSDKGGKSRKELEREVGSSTMKEKEKKDTESSAVANESKPPAEEARGPPKEEKKRSEAERRVRNKVSRERPGFVSVVWSHAILKTVGMSIE